jgi:HEAT repeat protein
MPPPLAVNLTHLSSKAWFLPALFVALGAAAGLLAWLGVVGLVLAIFQAVMQGTVVAGFRMWRRLFSWAEWPVVLGGAVGLTALGVAVCSAAPTLALLLGLLLQFVGVTACLAYVFIDQERFDVARGYKALHNPMHGQAVAANLAAFGPRVNVLLLLGATVAVVGGFALMNQALYESFGAAWYKLKADADGEARVPLFVDFLMYSIINLYRVVDLLDVANSYNLVHLTYVQQARWPSSTLLSLYKSFFTLVLLQQIFAALRIGRLLAETISDFWSPHAPIHQRACGSLPQYGPGAVWPLLLSLRSAAQMSPEQRGTLSGILADIGPECVPILGQHLRDDCAVVRGVAALALGRLHALDVVPALAALRTDHDDWVRQCAAEALGQIGAAATPSARRRWSRRRRRLLEGPWLVRLFRGLPATRPALPDPLDLTVDGLRAYLGDASAAVRTHAARALGRLGKSAAPASDALIARLGEPHESLRVAAAEALGRLGVAGPGTVAALSTLLGDASPEIRAAGARALGELRHAAAAAVPALVPLLQETDDVVRQAAAEAVAQIGALSDAAAEALTAGLESADNAVRAQTAEALGEIGEAAGEAAVEALSVALVDDNERVRASAAEALGRMGEAAAEAVPELADALSDPDSWVSALAAEALGEIGEDAVAAVPALVRALAHANPQVRANAAEALGEIGHEARPALAPLTAALNDAEDAVRVQALRALGKIGGLDAAAHAALLAALPDANPDVRAAAVTALGVVGPDLETAAALRALLADPSEEVKVALTAALPRLATAEAAPLLAVLLRDDAAAVQAAAAHALGRLGPAATATGHDLLRLTLTGPAEAREEAVRAIALIEPPEAVAAYLGCLEDGNAEVRVLASAGLMKADALPPEAGPALVAALRDPEIQVRANAARALARLEELPDDAVPALQECAADADDGLRLHAVLALRRASAGQSSEALQVLLADANPRIRLLAAQGLLEADTDDAEARAALVQALADPARRVRKAALGLIETFGARGVAFRAMLQKRADEETDPELSVRVDRLLRALPEPQAGEEAPQVDAVAGSE